MELFVREYDSHLASFLSYYSQILFFYRIHRFAARGVVTSGMVKARVYSVPMAYDSIGHCVVV